MVSPAFRRILRSDEEALHELLHADAWEMFALPVPARDELRRQLDEGAYVGDGDEGWWIDAGGEAVGLVRVTDLDAADWDPQLHIRILPHARGRGLGRAATRFAAERAFSRPGQMRFEAQTRVDNAAMRRTLVTCGWVLEACYRGSWPTRDGKKIDSVGYALLRSDWERGELTPVDWAALLEQDG